jgi:hypothetical protein
MDAVREGRPATGYRLNVRVSVTFIVSNVIGNGVLSFNRE